jgi:hypothetical protein
MTETIRLLHHPLKQFDTLRVSAELLRRRYASGCRTSSCRGDCCCGGADVDVGQRDHILTHADAVRALLDCGQPRETAAWFSEPFADPDFPTGTAASTALHAGQCIFLDRQRRCVLQRVEENASPGTPPLKPFFCRAFPLTIEDGVVVLDDKPCQGKTACCGASIDGPLTVFDVCASELAFVLGEDGLVELRDYANRESRE